MGEVEHISAVTFAVRDMARSVAFYRKLGFSIFYGGEDASFSSFRFGEACVNLAASSSYEGQAWGRVIFRVTDADTYRNLLTTATVAAAGRLYLASSVGSVAVVSAEAEWETLFVNDLDEEIFASPGIADGLLFLRTRSKLYAFGGE